MRISPLKIEIMLESNPLKFRILVQRLAVYPIRKNARGVRSWKMLTRAQKCL